MEAVVENIAAEVPPAQAAAAYALLIKIIGNILKAVPGTPESSKVRTLKKDGKAIAETLNSDSCISMLLLCGFEDTGATYHLPEGSDDRELLQNAFELLQALVASVSEESQGSAAAPMIAASAPAQSSPAAVGTSDKVSGPRTAAFGARDFARRDDMEARRQSAQEELAAARAAQKAQYVEGGNKNGYSTAPANGGGIAPAVATPPTANEVEKKPVKSPTAIEVEKKPAKSAFDFESRARKDAQADAAAKAQEDLRALQKQKYNQFKADPNAASQEAYKAPPSIAPGGKQDDGWFSGWFSGWGGSSSSGGGGGGRPDDKKPRMKTINDLPKPVQRG